MSSYSHHAAAQIDPLMQFHAVRSLEARTLLRMLLLASVGLLWRGLHTIRTCHSRSRQRRQLLLLDDRLLQDIGLTWEQAKQEARKPFWQA